MPVLSFTIIMFFGTSAACLPKADKDSNITIDTATPTPPSPFELHTKQVILDMQVASYTNFFADALIAEAERDSRIIGIHAAMGGGTGMNRFQKRFNSRTFDVGIAEQHAVTFAAGLACEGMAPFVAIYSTFLQRGYDQIVHDVCLQKLPGTYHPHQLMTSKLTASFLVSLVPNCMHMLHLFSPCASLVGLSSSQVRAGILHRSPTSHKSLPNASSCVCPNFTVTVKSQIRAGSLCRFPLSP